MKVPIKKLRQAVLVLLCFMVLACADKVLSPETQLKQWLKSVEVAIKDKKLGEIKSRISSEYADPQGNTRQKIMLRLALLFKQHVNIGFSNSISELSVNGETARMVVDTTFSESQAIARLGLTQEKYQFVLLLESDDGAWLLSSVSYSQVKE